MSSMEENTLPEGWKNKDLGDICDVVGGGTPKTKVSEYWGGEIVWLSPIDLPPIGEITFVSDSSKKITDLGLQKSSAKLLPKGPVVYSTRASIGKIAIAEVPLSTNQGFTNFICNEQISNYFLCYALKHFNKNIEELSNSTTFKEVSKTAIKSFKIPLPPLEEQKRIVAKIDVLFAKIDQAISLTEESLIQAKNLLPSVLNEVFEKGNTDGWKFEKMGVLGKLTSSKRIYKKEYVSQGIPFYRSKEIKELSHNRKLSVELFISEQRYTEIKNKFDIPNEGDLLLTAVGTIGEMYIVKKNEKFYFKDGNIMWLKDFLTLNPYYLKYALTNFVERLKALSHGAAYQALTIEKLKEYSIPIPTFKEQEKIVAKLDGILNQTIKTRSKFEEQLSYLRQLKSSILSKAFKGEL